MMLVETVSHDELVEVAKRWLAKSVGCGVVVTEMTSATSETPDAIGWHGKTSILIECKTSRADFHADKKKPFRLVPSIGVGAWRFFLAPKGILRPDDMPEGWGLIEWDGRRVLRTYRCPKQGDMFYRESPFKPNSHSEWSMILSTCRRLICECPHIRPKVASRYTQSEQTVPKGGA